MSPSGLICSTKKPRAMIFSPALLARYNAVVPMSLSATEPSIELISAIVPPGFTRGSRRLASRIGAMALVIISAPISAAVTVSTDWCAGP